MKIEDKFEEWTPDGQGWVCIYCGASDPDKGDRCGNCDENPFKFSSEDKLLTKHQLATLRAATRRRGSSSF